MSRPREQNSFLINLSSSLVAQSASDFTTYFPNVITLSGGQWQGRLVSISVWNTQFSVSDFFNNRTFRFTLNGGDSPPTWYTGTLPSGVYGAGDLIDGINTIMNQLVTTTGYPATIPLATSYSLMSNCIQLSINEPTLGFAVQFYSQGVTPPTFAIDLTNNGTSNLYLNFGSANRAYGIFTDGGIADPVNQQILFPDLADVSNGITSYNVLCDISSSSTTAGQSGQTIFNFVPNNVPPGALFNLIPPYPVPFEVAQPSITSIRIQIQDNLNRPVNLQEGSSPQNKFLVNATTLSLLLTRIGV